jgi:hypothetical protein
MKCFDGVRAEDLDVRPFKFTHKLMGHPALSLANLAEALPALPKEQVFYSSGALTKGDDFDRAHLDKKNGLSLEKTIETIRTSDSYIMVRAPEAHASFQELHRELVADVEDLMHQRGIAGKTEGSMLYLFIASPNSVTPFHIDRYSTLLFQFQGSKEVTVFPPGDDRVVPAETAEDFMAHAGERPTWKPEIERLGECFAFSPGEALHIPFIAGHHVKNGPSDVSISMSIIFNTPQTVALTKAMLLNRKLRKLLQPVGIEPRSVGCADWRDMTKAHLWATAAKAAHLIRGKRA